MKILKMSAIILCLTLAAVAPLGGEQELKDIPLPKPRTEGGMPLMQALKERKTTRTFSGKKLPLQVLSDLLWAAAGINRQDSGKRTAPSARNWQEVQVYVVMEEGTYHYDAKANSLKAVVKGDLRKLTGRQDFVDSAPINLVYVAEFTKMKGASPEYQVIFSAADTGFISQNVYLFCASEGLATVVRGMVEHKPLAEAMHLSEDMRIILAQTVGYPKE